MINFLAILITSSKTERYVDLKRDGRVAKGGKCNTNILIYFSVSTCISVVVHMSLE